MSSIVGSARGLAGFGIPSSTHLFLSSLEPRADQYQCLRIATSEYLNADLVAFLV